MAAVPIKPSVAGFRPFKTPLNIWWSFHFSYTLHNRRTIINDGRTTANVAVNEPSMLMNSDAPAFARTS